MSTAISGPRSRAAFRAACKVIPGGVNSPVRAFKRLGGQPPFIAGGKGAWIRDLDGRRYVDCVLSWGPLLHGHAHPAIVDAISAAARNGSSFGAPTLAETALARALCRALPGMQRVRLVSSGTEACMSALRLARAATGRELVLKFDGCYHGHADQLLVAAGSGCATLNTPDSAGVAATSAAQTISAPYNDLKAVERIFRQQRRRIAAVIVEPVAGNMGLVPPAPGFLDGLRALCSRDGSLLVFDEVMTGFRVAWGGWQRVCGIRPDLTCLGKVVGGGMPLAAYGGRADLMGLLAPEGPCYQAGTLSGNPCAVAAGLASLELASAPGFYRDCAASLTGLISGLGALARRHGLPLQLAQAGTMWGFFFSERPVDSWTAAAASDVGRWQAFARGMLARGVYIAPSPFEAAFWSAAHGAREVRHILRAAEATMAEMG